MNVSTRRIFFGVALVLLGGLFLVQQIFNFHVSIAATIVAIVFALAGLAFLYVVASNRENWWALIPGFVLLGLGLLIACSQFFPSFANKFGGTLFLSFIALPFLLIYLLRREAWWAIIPAGVMFTIAIVAGVAGFISNGFATGAIFFLGIGLTFAVVGLLPVGRRDKWPWIPAGICLLIGTLLMMGSKTLMSSFFGYFWSGLIILGGAYLIIRSVLPKKQ